VPGDENLIYDVANGVATITINAPDQGNSLSWDMRDGIGDRLEDASADLAVRAVIITGAGPRHFCTGANLGGPRAESPARPEGAPDRTMGDAARMIKRGWQRLVSCILDCEKPVIAAVNGTAAGGGAQLAIACDFVVMADTARIIEVFVRRGIMPDAGGAYLLPRAIGLHKAKELLLLGEDVSAVDAVAMGLAMKAVPADELMAEVHELATKLAAGPTKALAMTKWLLNRSFESSRHTAFEEEAYAQDLVQTSADSQEGIAAFVERRTPEFKGW
jgi:2-(1,2-epoxy-1,2-dihydrophenyl)acetyl-CoA isomerase